MLVATRRSASTGGLCSSGLGARTYGGRWSRQVFSMRRAIERAARLSGDGQSPSSRVRSRPVSSGEPLEVRDSDNVEPLDTAGSRRNPSNPMSRGPNQGITPRGRPRSPVLMQPARACWRTGAPSVLEGRCRMFDGRSSVNLATPTNRLGTYWHQLNRITNRRRFDADSSFVKYKEHVAPGPELGLSAKLSLARVMGPPDCQRVGTTVARY